ncbi:tyrosine-type recombinase/integrase [Nonomuraea sp. NPDC049400]|uniref:tyrosine-type recombinase/integrase n=1 Tax=Nonomuraea sp. NPDC049400 TaxID=3364352 RepID=UPI0037B30BEE
MAELLDDLAASFARDLRASDKAERTITIYLQSIRFFKEWLEENGKPTTLDSLTKPELVAWLGHLAARNSTSTVLTRFRGMRRFVRWLLAEEEITSNPLANVEPPKPPETPVPIFTDEEVAALIKAAAGTDFLGRRNEAIVRVFFDTGIRISELAGIQLDDVDFNHEVIFVTGKGRRPRAVPFGAKTARALDRYIRARRQHKNADLPGLWLSQRGTYSTDGIDDLLRNLAKKAGIEDVHAHRFRHTFAHRWLVSGGQERDLMRLAGWRSSEMLGRYGASAADERARQAHKRMKLGDQL